MFSKWLPMEPAILKQTLKLKIIKLNLFLKNMQTHAHLTNAMLVFMQLIFIWGYFMNIVLL